MSVLQYVRQYILRMLAPIVRSLGFLHLPFTRKRITADMVDEILELARPGDIILSTAFGEFSNLLIDGTYKHGVMFCGKHDCVQAVKTGVNRVNIYQALLTRDRVALVRSAESSEYQRALASRNAIELVGRGYDFMYELTDGPDNADETFYCSEVLWYCHTRANPDVTIPLRSIMGMRTVMPDDFRQEPYWDTLWQSR